MIAASVRAGHRGQKFQSADYLDLFLAGGQRLQRAAQWKILPIRRRPPRGGNRAIRKIYECRPQWRARGRCRQAAGRQCVGRKKFRGQQRLKSRQCDARAEASQKISPAEAGVALKGDFIIGRCILLHNLYFVFPPVMPVIWLVLDFKSASAVTGAMPRVL